MVQKTNEYLRVEPTCLCAASRLLCCCDDADNFHGQVHLASSISHCGYRISRPLVRCDFVISSEWGGPASWDLRLGLWLCVECVASAQSAQLVSTNGETCSKMWPNKFAMCLSTANDSVIMYSTNYSWLADSEYLLNSSIVQQVRGTKHRNALQVLWRLLLLIYAFGSTLWLMRRNGRSVRTTPIPISISSSNPSAMPKQNAISIRIAA